MKPANLTSNVTNQFTISPITEDIRQRIWNKSYPSTCGYDLNNLAYLNVLYYNFDHVICKGELIVNVMIAPAVQAIFQELFEQQYPIEQITLVDAFDGDDNRSMAANNSSAFNYRFIDSTTILSNHSHGLAIDINPLYNPYIKEVHGKERILPIEGAPYVDRTIDHPYYIKKGDICYNTFIRHGFSWGGEWEHSKDYQHFEYTPKESLQD